jgi:hypothetical protein
VPEEEDADRPVRSDTPEAEPSEEGEEGLRVDTRITQLTRKRSRKARASTGGGETTPIDQ